MVRPCEYLAGAGVVTLMPANRLAWDVCERAILISPYDMNGNPTLANLQIALDGFPNEITAAEYGDLLDRVGRIYQEFWLPFAAIQRDRQKENPR